MLTILREINGDSACKQIGIDFNELFVTDFVDDPYAEHTWYINNHEKVVVINALPPRDKQDRIFWEEWYRMRNEEICHHHVLTLWRPKCYDAIWVAPDKKDDIHPESVLGKKWYVVEDPDMRPLLLRR
jgi:hypothetical protein